MLFLKLTFMLSLLGCNNSARLLILNVFKKIQSYKQQPKKPLAIFFFLAVGVNVVKSLANSPLI